MISAIISERMKMILALACPPLILVSAAAISLLTTHPERKMGIATSAAATPIRQESEIDTGHTPMSRSDVSELRDAWDGALAWWWQESKPLPWSAHCAATSRDSFRTGWYPLSCFMVPVQRLGKTNIAGHVSLGETPIYSLSHLVHDNHGVTSDIMVLDCRKGHECKPTTLHHLTMDSDTFNAVSTLVGIVRNGLPVENAHGGPSPHRERNATTDRNG